MTAARTEREADVVSETPPAASIGRTLVNVFAFTVAVVGLFVLVAFYAQSIVGAGDDVPVAQGVSPEAGEAIFWGKGKCSTCHSLGSRGSVVRCPNLENIGANADARAGEAGLESGTAYLVESLADPPAYVVDGYSGDVMPKVAEPPISLSGEEISAVVAYLQAQGGTVDTEAIVLPPSLQLAGGGAGGAPSEWAPYMTGDPEAGRALFHEGAEGAPACAACHAVGGEGGDVGPSLDDVALVRGPEYVIQSILDPSAEIVAGYEEAGAMPPVFAGALSVQQLHDILAYLLESAGLPVDAAS